MKSEPGLPVTLDNAAAARVRLIVWCKSCQHEVEPIRQDGCSLRCRDADAELRQGARAFTVRAVAGGGR